MQAIIVNFYDPGTLSGVYAAGDQSTMNVSFPMSMPQLIRRP